MTVGILSAVYIGGEFVMARIKTNPFGPVDKISSYRKSYSGMEDLGFMYYLDPGIRVSSSKHQFAGGRLKQFPIFAM